MWALKVQLRFENENKDGFGSGRVKLLRLIHELGSLNRAAKLLGMSYRGAWGKVKKAEQLWGIELVASEGAKRDGYRLTPAGLALVKAYEELFAEVERFATERAETLLPLAQTGAQTVAQTGETDVVTTSTDAADDHPSQ